MQPNISEFSYGYALTEELIHWHGTTLTAAPIFPSLYQEGQSGGGWDVKLKRPGVPLFLQFKLAHYMVRMTAQECKNGLFDSPFFRMHIRPSRHSEQHEMLLDLENAGNEVYYCAPAFHQPFELNDAYINHQVKDRSIGVRPSWVGPLLDDDDHHVAFQLPGSRYFYSKPRFIPQEIDYKNFTKTLEGAFRQRSKTSLSIQALNNTAERLMQISRKRMDISFENHQRTRDEMSSRHPIERIAFYAHMLLDAQVYIVNEANESN